jgi:hypothetical protein
VVDGAAWDAEIRQRRASRTDMARAIAAAEQAEFDQLLARRPDPKPRRAYRKQEKRLRKRRADQWPDELIDQLRTARNEGSSYEAIGAALGRTQGAVEAQARRLVLTRCSSAAV